MAKSKISLTKKLAFIAVPLVLIQVVLLLRFKQPEKTTSFRNAMDQALESNRTLPPERRGLIAINLSLNDYKTRNGKYPDTLQQMIPDYFETIPADPLTGQAYEYKLMDTSFLLGRKAIKALSGEEKKVKKKTKQELLLASLKTYSQDLNVYDPTGKRDPFRSVDLTQISKKNRGKSPLEQFDYQEFRLSAVLLGSGEPKAILEDGNGKGHTVKMGEGIGLYGGVIDQILEDRLVIKETTIDFTGQQNTRTIDIFLPTQETDFGNLDKEASIGPQS